MMGGLLLLVHQTRLGCAMRAVAENPTAAILMGVNTNKVIAITFMLGSGLAAVAGLMISARYGIVRYYMGSILGLKAFTAASARWHWQHARSHDGGITSWIN